MKHFIALLLITSCHFAFTQEKEEIPQLPKIPNMPKMEQHTGEVKKVFFAMQGDAKFTAYQVLWKGQEIIIVDMMSNHPKEKGDKVNFMSMVMKMPNFGNKGGAPRSILQFTVVPDIGALMNKKD